MKQGRLFPSSVYSVCQAVIFCLFFAAPAFCQTAVTPEQMITAGDRLKLEVYGHADVSAEMEVTPENIIHVPLLGQVGTAGKTLAQLTAEITQRLDKDYLVEPKVTLERIGQEPFYILGQVQKPGTYPYRTGLDIRKAAAIAGGFTSRANQKEFTVVRHPGNAQEENLTAGADTPLLPGDTVEVKPRWF